MEPPTKKEKIMLDLTDHSDKELSLVVMNDEYLYNQFMRCEDESDLAELVADIEYTNAQFDELHNDLMEEQENDYTDGETIEICSYYIDESGQE